MDTQRGPEIYLLGDFQMAPAQANIPSGNKLSDKVLETNSMWALCFGITFPPFHFLPLDAALNLLCVVGGEDVKHLCKARYRTSW